MEINGTIHAISGKQKVSEKFSKREFILETEKSTTYSQFIKLEFTQDKCDLLNSYEVGQDVSVEFNLRGNLYKETAFNRLQAWKIEKI